MMLYNYIFIVSLTICLAFGADEPKKESDTKDKRQINEQQVIYGHHPSGQFINRPRQQQQQAQEQIPEYYSLLQGVHQQQQVQQPIEARALNNRQQKIIQRPLPPQYQQQLRIPSEGDSQIQYGFLPQQQSQQPQFHQQTQQQYHQQTKFQPQIQSQPQPQPQPQPQQSHIQSPQQSSTAIQLQQYENNPNVKPISEAEFQELLKKSEAELRAATATSQKYSFQQTPSGAGQQQQQPQPQQLKSIPQPHKTIGLGSYKSQTGPHQFNVPQQQQQLQPQPQQLKGQQQQQFIQQQSSPSAINAYKKSAFPTLNPLGDFSLEKELEKLEASNKALDETVAFITPELSQYQSYQSPQPQAEKLIQYSQEEDEGAAAAAAEEQKEFSAIAGKAIVQHQQQQQQQQQRQHPSISAAPLKYQYFSQADEDEQNQKLAIAPQKTLNNNYKIIQSSPQSQAQAQQYQYQKQQQQQQPANIQYYNSKPTPTPAPAASISKPLEQQLPASHSSIYVSQSTGLRNKIQPAQQQPQHQQQHLQQSHQQQPQQITYPKKVKINQPVTLPPPDSKTPISQEEFQALIDAGFKVTAIPVPVPVSNDKYREFQQQQQQQKQLAPPPSGTQQYYQQQSSIPQQYHQQQPQLQQYRAQSSANKQFVQQQSQIVEQQQPNVVQYQAHYL